ncbi:MAG: formate--tetrahydrofolate ligase [Bdellovibrionales bacterium GWB1_52_6]|nr:MAG: formate--tetrahydrofolate ligase [Bdellovibrionales bacterium GWB1_52_6]OFZ03247.1 MAG: formate--tetrahydrofolate ligase [Bdellovibrionales bacterium GWA1_52_35]HCM40568.1 formate--tetrahydrofolate ligase [Bdellovibrionales bacterium]
MSKLAPKNVPSDIEIAQSHKMTHIRQIAEKAGLKEEEIEYYGNYKAKIDYRKVLARLQNHPDGKLIDVTACTPTPLGEGKTVTSIGLNEGLNHIGKRSMLCLREPSLGPVFGIKGGAAGGGYSQVVPMEDLNLHFTGDIHAISIAHNLCAAAIDTSILLKNPLNINPLSVQWRRVVDMNDRCLRQIVVGLGGKENGVPRETGFDIAVASELMAILALASDLKDLRQRIGRILLGYNYDGQPVTAEDLKVAGAMTALLKDAIKPNLIQSLEGNPAFIHAGPFANIAHGNNSVIADRVALKLGDYVVTESGFASDMGAEKFMDITCRVGGFKPNCVVITCTVRALKMHGMPAAMIKGLNAKKLSEVLKGRHDEYLEKGLENLDKHIENMRKYGIPVVNTINRFVFDHDDEIKMIQKRAESAGASASVPIECWMHGGAGSVEAAQEVVKACAQPSNFNFLYPDDYSIKQKIETIATEIYGAAGVNYLPEAETKIKKFTELGYGKLPICMAKTHLSLSADPDLKGRPRGFKVTVRDIRASLGAGFLYPLLGDMRTMPGLGGDPAYRSIDVDENGTISGLF